MFPGFVSIYRDKDKYIHLYFYPGIIDDSDKPYYNSLDLSNCKLPYKEQNNTDSSVEYIFDNKKIKSITCQLIHSDNINKDIVKLELK